MTTNQEKGPCRDCKHSHADTLGRLRCNKVTRDEDSGYDVALPCSYARGTTECEFERGLISSSCHPLIKRLGKSGFDKLVSRILISIGLLGSAALIYLIYIEVYIT